MKTTIYLRAGLVGFVSILALIIIRHAEAVPTPDPSPGMIDSRFDLTGGGRWAGLVGGGSFGVTQLKVAADDRIIVGGAFGSVNSLNCRQVVRLDSDGGVDGSFHSPFVSSGQLNVLGNYRDGKLLASGYLAREDGVLSTKLYLLNTDGTFDTSFQAQISSEQSVLALAVDDRNRIIVSLSWYWTGTLPLLKRLLPDGSEDTTFATASASVYPAVRSIVPLPGGKILIGGVFDSSPKALARLNEDGTRDETFNPQFAYGEYRPSLQIIAVQADGKIVVGGTFDQVGGVSCTNLARLNADGTLDSQFKVYGINNGRVDDIVIQPDQKIVVSGSFSSLNGKTNLSGLVRLLPDGSLDSSFDTQAFRQVCDKLEVVHVALDSSNRIVLAAIYGGDYTRTSPLVYRLLTNGAVDTAFSAPIGAGTPRVESVTAMPDGSVCISGAFTGVRDQFRNGFARVSLTGDVLPGWEIPASVRGEGSISAVLADGSVIAGGTWQETSDLGSGLFRFQPDGSLDPNWFYDAWSPDSMSVIHDIAVTPDGRIILVGMNRAGMSAIQQLLPNGRPDPDFHIPLIYGVDDIGVEKVLRLPNGYFLIKGEITWVDDIIAQGYAWMTSNGNVYKTDDIFHGGIADMALQADGKFLVSGSFTSTNPSKTDVIQRHNSEGAIDSSFVLPDNLSGYANAVAVQPNGKILIGGGLEFTVGTNKVVKRLVRLLPNGALDPDFLQGGCDDIVQNIDIGPDGSIFLAGSFTTYNGAYLPGVVRLVGDPISPPAATRILPAVARPGDTIRVSILVNVPAGTTSFALDEAPPVPWNVSNISNGGTYDSLSGKIHFSVAQTPLTYDVTVPTKGVGPVAFSGAVTVDGIAAEIAGPGQLLVLGAHPADRAPADFLLAESEVTAYADAWKTAQYWPGSPNPIPQSYVSRAGYLWCRATNYTVLTGSLLPPLSWLPVSEIPVPSIQGGASTTAIRSVEHGFIEGEPLKVRLEIHPAAGTLAYTVEETLNQHWTPIANSGEFAFNPNVEILKWGPYFDDQPRVLEYQVVPAVSTRMRQPMHGVVSCDGFDVPITGTTLIKRTCHLRSVNVRPGGGMTIEANGLGSSVSPMVEASSDLIHWIQLPNPEIDQGAILIFDPDNNGSAVRFYRVRID